MTAAIDLAPEHRETVLALLRKHLPGAAAWAYGSRAQWTANPHSDLDLAVFPAPRQARAVADLREAFEESNLPFRVDLFVWDDIPAEFRARIESTHVPLAQADTVRPPDRRRRPARDGWRTVALGECIEAARETYSSRDNWPRIAYLDTGSIIDNRISHIRELRPGKDKIPMRARTKANAGDIVYSMVRPNRRHFGFLKTVPDNFLVSTGFFVFHGKPNVASSEFLYWFLTQDRIVEYLHSLAEQSTAAYPSIKPTDLENILVELPPLDRQCRIAGILGALDDKIELNRKADAILDTMALDIFTDWFVNFGPVRAKMNGDPPYLARDLWSMFPERLVDTPVGMRPAGWRLAALPEIMEIDPRRSLSRGTVAPYVDMANMPTAGHSPIAAIDRPAGSGKRFENGDTLIARITPCLENGKTAYVDFLPPNGVGWGSTEYIVLRPKPPLPPGFGYCLARSAGFREFAVRNMTGTCGRQRVPAAALAQFYMPAPPEEIAAAFRNVVNPLLARAAAAARECRALASVRDALLPQLMSGTLPVEAEQAQTDGT